MTNQSELSQKLFGATIRPASRLAGIIFLIPSTIITGISLRNALTGKGTESLLILGILFMISLVASSITWHLLYKAKSKNLVTQQQEIVFLIVAMMATGLWALSIVDIFLVILVSSASFKAWIGVH